MIVTRVRPGEAPEIADKIYIDHLSDGRIVWTGSVDIGGAAVFGYSRGEFANAEEAEFAAIQWASGHGATELTIETADA